LGIGVAANASFSAAFSGIPTTAVYIRAGYHLSNAELGLVLAMLGLGIAVSELPWGMLTDRLGDRRVLLTGLVSTAAALVLMALFAVPVAGQAGVWQPLACGLLLVGLLGGSVNGSSGRAVMAWFLEGERGFAMSIRQTAVPVGGALGALMLPMLVSASGFACGYLVLASLCLLSAGFAWRWLFEPPAEVPVSPGRSIPIGLAEGSPLRNGEVWRLAVSIGMLCVPQIAVLTFASVFLPDFGAVGLVTISVTLGIVQAGAAVFRGWSGRWTDRKGNRRRYLRACCQLSAAIFAILAVWVAVAGRLPAWHAPSQAFIIVLLAAGGVCSSAWHGVAFTELATLAGTRRAGTALAMGNSGAFLCLFLTPLAIPLLLEWGGWPLVWLSSGACAFAALPILPKVNPTAELIGAKA
jgi:MFS family permease